MFFNKPKISDLHSGEREIATSILEISKHSIYRYNFVHNVLKSHFDTNEITGLDIFCGNGYGTFFLAKYLNLYSIIGIDGCNAAIKQANKYYKRDNIKYNCKVFPFSLAKNKYDFIVCLESIEHVTNHNLFINNLYNSLKKDSILIISTPNKDYFPNFGNEDKFHKKIYSLNEFETFLVSNNFEIINKCGQNVFSVENNKITGILQKEERIIIDNPNSQHMIFVCKKQII